MLIMYHTVKHTEIDSVSKLYAYQLLDLPHEKRVERLTCSWGFVEAMTCFKGQSYYIDILIMINEMRIKLN